MSDQDEPPGISAFEFEDLPVEALPIVRTLLRNPGIGLLQLRTLLNAADHALTEAELRRRLAALEQMGAVLRDTADTYRVHLRRKLSASAPELWESVAPRRRRATGLLDQLDLDNLPSRPTRPLFDSDPPAEDQS